MAAGWISRGGSSSLPFLSMAAAQPRGGDAVLLPVVQGWLKAAAEAEAHAATEERGAAQRFSDVQYYFSCYIISVAELKISSKLFQWLLGIGEEVASSMGSFMKMMRLVLGDGCATHSEGDGFLRPCRNCILIPSFWVFAEFLQATSLF